MGKPWRHTLLNDIRTVRIISLVNSEYSKIFYSVSQGFRKLFDEKADSTDPILYNAGYENIAIDVHVPVLDVPIATSNPAAETLSQVVIQGSFDMGRRSYARIFSELLETLAGQNKLVIPL
jgi:hypothetical protein